MKTIFLIELDNSFLSEIIPTITLQIFYYFLSFIHLFFLLIYSHQL